MTSLFYVLCWVLGSVCVGLGIGFYLGRSNFLTKHREQLKKERDTTLKSLVDVLKSTDQLTQDLDSRTSEIAAVGRHVVDLQLPSEMQDAQKTLLRQIAGVLESNMKLEEDLQFTRHRMEEQAEEIDRTRKEARTDALSGVANRKAFDEKLQFLLTTWKRQKEPFALVLADVDHFKWINDTHGHPAGDRVVTHMGQFLRHFVREGDFVGRYGGDEFAFLLPHVDLEAARRIAERLLQAVTRNNFIVGPTHERVAITLSIGVATVKPDDTPELLINRADTAVYQSKREGRNQVNACGPDGAIVDPPPTKRAEPTPTPDEESTEAAEPVAAA